jgi:ammonium transporter
MTNISTQNQDDWDNATWVLTSSFIIITMQSGFGLLESGMVSSKNQIHIMVKNMTDILFGGFTFWIFGYAFIFGDNSNGFISAEDFFTDKDNNYGWLFSNFFFQFTFSTTATTIVSGCLAERTNFLAYILFSMLNTFIYSVPAHWIWNKNGWLYKLGVVDFAGCGPVHMVGGLTGLVGTYMLGPRKFKDKPSSYVNSIFGLFMLWWGWLGFNCGSTLGITGEKWLYASKSAVTTVLSTVGGGIISFMYCYIKYNNKFPIEIIINGVLGSLVSITGCCIYVKTIESIFIGAIGAIISIKSNDLMIYYDIDDPVGAIGVHYFSAIWGIISSGFFVKNINSLNVDNGLFYGGGFYLLGIQFLEVISISMWTLIVSFALFYLVDVTIGLRVNEIEEKEGADIVYHIIPDNLIEKINIEPDTSSVNELPDVLS